jgi:sulfur carrier protein
MKTSDLKVTLNGKERKVRKGATLTDLLDEVGARRESTAVAVNHFVIPRSELAGRVLREGDAVEIIEAVGGG